MLSVNDPIAKYLPKYPKATGDRITINHLLTHTSGLPNYTDDPELLLNRTNPMTPSELMLLFEYLPLDFEPGTDFRYSNSGYIVLGAIIEAVTGQSYEAFLHHCIFKPLGMLHSGYARREAGIPDRADGYTVEEVGTLVDAMPVHFSVLHTAGALYSTVEDMLLWDQALYTENILSRHSIERMLTPSARNYGYGWFVEQRYGRRHTYHGGFLDGFNTIFDRWVDDRLCVVVFSNDDEAPVCKIALGLAAIAFGKPYIMPIRKYPVQIDVNLLPDYVGAYQIEPGRNRMVILERDTLRTYLTGEPRRILLPQAPDTFFFLLDNTATLVFTRDAVGAVNAGSLCDQIGCLDAVKLPDSLFRELWHNHRTIILDREILLRYVGFYELESNLAKREGFTLTVAYQDDHLLAQVSSGEVIALYPCSETEFFHKSADFGLQFTCDDAGNVIGCRLKMGAAEVCGIRIK